MKEVRSILNGKKQHLTRLGRLRIMIVVIDFIVLIATNRLTL